ncbi:hypothetical protein AK812_SmicGene42443 [Symbiodinium microadriaticum]|uniref:Uncharacterized protein n=1 Tax=Symbiodinium microadriaticum TaxID=2951 RepID=A0A1Q9C3J4_SYMMI|nr:hypothetical protein AK812_SmicGene42443 [Symbiodinium microadriaticum]
MDRQSPRQSPRAQPPQLRKRTSAPQNQGKLHQAGRHIASGIPNSARERSDSGREASPSQASRRSNSSELSRPPRPGRTLAPLPEASPHPGPVSPGARRESSELIGLAKGGEALMRRLADVNSVNGELRRKLELQSNEISLLEASSRQQQQLLKEFEHRAKQARQSDAAAAEAKAKAAAAQREEQLQKELSARAQLANLEMRQAQAAMAGQPGQPGAFNELPKLPQAIFKAPSTGESGGSKILAMEMEMNLVRSRFARETTMRQAAEKTAADAQQEQREMSALIDRQAAEIDSLRRELAQRAEQAGACNPQQQSKAEERLRRERGKFAAVSRLEGVLPKHMLLKALA